MKVKEKDSNVIEKAEKIVNTKKENKRDASVDLIRIVACLFVIATHMSLQVLNQAYNRIDWSRLLEKSFLADGVPLFLMITGFFIANGRSYKKIWKQTAVKVLLPSIIYILFTQIFYMFIINKESIVWCIQNIVNSLNPILILKGIVTGNMATINGLCEHLWYVLTYVKIIIWVPLLWLICMNEKNSILARRIVIIAGILAAIITDIQRFTVLPEIGFIKVFNIVDRSILYVLLGYELFVHKDKLKGNKKVFIISSIVFLFINFIRYKIEVQYMVVNSFTDIVGRETFIGWKDTCISIISGLALFAGIYSIKINNEFLSKIILWIADKTFGIYLIHYLIIAKVDLYKFEIFEKFYEEIIYLIVGVICTFAISLLSVYILRKLKELLLKGIKVTEENIG